MITLRPLTPLLAAILLTPGALGQSRIDLSGRWSVRLDPNDEGVSAQWFAAPLAGGTSMKLPGTTDRAGLGEPETDPNPGFLSREHKFVGAAWYQRRLEIPEAWRKRPVELHLERVLWESRVWVDGVAASSQDSLGTPHVHWLGRLSPGQHLLTLRIDNRMIHPIGNRSHCYTEFTQTIWNGAVGRIELRARQPVTIELLRVFPDAVRREVKAELTLAAGPDAPPMATAHLAVRERKSGRTIGTTSDAVEFARGATNPTISTMTIPLAAPPATWDEFSPALHELEARIADMEPVTTTFGFRSLTRNGNMLFVNGRPTFLRGNMDCAQYPLTGHPPTDVARWKRMLGICRDHGLNQIRFHSWCPPEAAFEAADAMGFYLQAEVLWIDGWMGGPNPRKDMDTPGYPKGVGKGDRTIDHYVRAEMRRMLDTYGNHPSFCFFAIGNELGSSYFKTMGAWIQQEKERDPRRLYAASTARAITPADDFSDTHHIPGVGGVVNRLGVPGTDWDYEDSYARAPVPVIAHEMGQMPVYPDWSEIRKYTGPVRARNLELFREQARNHGIAGQCADLQRASGAMNRILYKNEMEAQLRSPGCAGVNWLSMQDFPGQGEALVGWLDTFYESKGIVSPRQFRRYSAATVPLARFKTFVWTSDETFSARVQVSHWGERTVSNAKVAWTLRDPTGRVHAAGTFGPATLQPGSVSTLGEIACSLATFNNPTRLNLEIAIKGTPFANDWHTWVFPPAVAPTGSTDVVVCDAPEAALEALSESRRVLLLASRLGRPDDAKHAAWMPLFWSARFFPGQNRDTLGALVQSSHPALADFPTDDHLDWQWRDICEGARGFVLNGFPPAYRPIVQPVSDYHFNDKLGTIFEVRTKEGGRLLVCGYDIASRLDERPAARQLRASLLAYAEGDSFNPKTEVGAAQIAALFPVVPEANAEPPPGFEKAVLYVQAGARHPSTGDVPWSPQVDKARIVDASFSYEVQCNAVWKDGTGTAWWGSPSLRVQVKIARPDLYTLHVHFHDWNDNGRTGRIRFEGREFTLGAHTGTGRWVRLHVLREDCLDGRLALEAACDSGPNIQITAIALVPQ
ncbi:MAG TPA: glycoside hydrolase family 2 TIM barrel-domain containing protein [Candidatus Paceibacterota bacterium]|nr:glycoside hydrolase family 2 TIM barrel-domain containing protein [Candidatus Paceibacterota bacterium]